MSFFSFSLLVGVFLSTLVQTSHAYTFEDCERWAKDGECTNNPRFIWVHCLSSCLAHAKDDNDKCSKWRDEGECSANMKYGALNFDNQALVSPPPDHTPSVALDFVGHTANGQPCPSLATNGVYKAALVMQSRITNILKHNSFVGFARDAPSEFLQSYGVLEGILYTLRLYDIVLSTGRVASRSEKRIQEIISDIEDSLNGYDGDRLTRRMRGHLYHLEAAGQLVTAYLEKEMHEVRMAYAHNEGGIGCQELLHLEINDVHQLYTTPTVPPKQLSAASQVKDSPPVFTLANGIQMSSLGLGTWKLNGQTCETAVYDAIKVGYRAIDTAQAYGNEAEVGKAISRAIKDGLVTRKDLFIATKLSFENDAGYAQVQALVQKQLQLLQTEYLDLYYLHSAQKNDEITRTTWKGLEVLHQQGTIRSLGLSNHNSEQLRHHFKVIGPEAVAPMVLQNKFDVYHPGKQLDNKGDFMLQTCSELNVQLVGYSPFSSFPFSMLPLDDPLVEVIAAQRQSLASRDKSKTEMLATPAAVLTQWSIQQGVAVIPRSTNMSNLATNYAAAVAVGTGLIQEGKLRGSAMKGTILSSDEMALLSSLSNLVSSPLVKPNYGTEPSNI